jgi:hypothetical protein
MCIAGKQSFGAGKDLATAGKSDNPCIFRRIKNKKTKPGELGIYFPIFFFGGNSMNDAEITLHAKRGIDFTG